jgi:NADH-quinone oxidoreductase subunit L
MIGVGDNFSSEPGLFDFGLSLTGIPVESRILEDQRDSSQLIVDPWQGKSSIIPYRWLILAGLCLFAGCVGKSAQLPLSTWLPDAMAGPTPVSALVHSATMVAAGVYLIGRLYPLLLPEVLTVIAYVGAITLVYGATCAVVQTDLKKILAYSTISQLGYMMLAMGVGGRDAGLFHLVTHAFFKSLLFLAAGSVIVACHHVQDVALLGGLRKKMPITAYTSLVGVIAIAGLAIPLIDVGFSGYHSKDSILAAALAFAKQNPQHGLLFALPLVTAGLTAFYMFRFWLLAFAGEPRDEELHRRASESSPLMTVPLVLLALFAAFCAIGGEEGPLFETIEASGSAVETEWLDSPNREGRHGVSDHTSLHNTASLWGLLAATIGTAAALAAYGAGLVDVKKSVAFFGPIRTFFTHGWQLDALYQMLFVRPLEFLARCGSLFDRFVIDGLLHAVSRFTLAVARFDRTFDERVVDGFVNHLAAITYETGMSLRHVQSGRLRQYVMALAAAAVVLFALAIVLIPKLT